ncbi:unnamed protein product [Bemisia tabaci]|nr:unnamed protein product [Bemisia tabaci]
MYFTILCCYLLYRLIQRLLEWRRQWCMIEKLPGPELENTFIGNIKETVVAPEDVPKESIRRFKTWGGIYRTWILGYPFVFISDAKYAEVFFTAKAVETKADIYRFLHVWVGLGLLNSRGETWQRRRKMIAPAFHFSALSDFCQVFINNTLTLVQQLRKNRDGTPVEVFSKMRLLALDNICEIAMGFKVDALNNPNHDYIRAVEDVSHMVMQRIVKPWYWNDLIFFLLPEGRKHWRDLNTIFELTDKAISNGKQKRTNKNSKISKEPDSKLEEDDDVGRKKSAFIDILLQASETDSIKLTDEDLRDEVNTFMFGGFDTAANSMSFTLFLLGLHPEIQEKCYQELYDIFQDSDRRPTMGDLQKMTYLEKVIRESLRLFPSVPMLGREVTQDVQLGDYIIPKNSLLALPVYTLHRDPTVFPDPDKFDPERFNPEEAAGRHPYAYVPFAAGPRHCIGQKFALLEEKVTLSYILRDFTLESEHGMEDLELMFTLVVRSRKPLNVRFKRRKHCQQSES